MTVSLYTGHVGSGKTYEVVRNVICPAISAGRDVVTNVDGLDCEAIYEWCERHRDKGETKPLGMISVVDRHEVGRPDFFPVKAGEGYAPSVWVPLGALVAIDEAPFVWGSDRQLNPAHLVFFREHRHITAADGTACDLVLISQTPDAIHRSLKSLVEFSVDCRRLAALGLNRKYTTVTYSGARRAGKYVMARRTQSYDRSVFKLYKSFASANGKVVQTDKRFTIWSSKLFWGVACIAPFVFIGAIWFLYSRIVSPGHSPVAQVVQSPADAARVVGTGVAGAASAVASAVVPSAAATQRPAAAGQSVSDIGGESRGPLSVWRVVGAVTHGGRRLAVLRRAGFPLRTIPLEFCQVSYGVPFSCKIADEVFEPEAVAAGPSSAGPASTDAGANLSQLPQERSRWAPDVAAERSIKR